MSEMSEMLETSQYLGVFSNLEINIYILFLKPRYTEGHLALWRFTTLLLINPELVINPGKSLRRKALPDW